VKFSRLSGPRLYFFCPGGASIPSQDLGLEDYVTGERPSELSSYAL